MANLTIAQIARLRKLTGDTDADDYDLEDSELQDEYDDNDSDFNLTIVSALRQRLALAMGRYDTSFSDGQGTSSESRSQEVAAIERMLAYWEGRLGIAGGLSGTLQSGTISLGLDQDEPIYD